MRYNPATDRAISIDEIAAQCRAAIMKAQTPEPIAFPSWGPALGEWGADIRWEDDILIAA